jgi:hypothetical protein
MREVVAMIQRDPEHQKAMATAERMFLRHSGYTQP